MRRFSAAIICILLVFSLISCTASEPEIVPEYDATVSEDSLDLNGQQLKMGMAIMSYYESDNSTLTYINDTDLGDLAAQRLKDVEEKYNCEIIFDYVARSGELAFNSAIAGTYVYDFINEESYFLENFMRANAFVDLTTLENIDVFDETKWGNRNIRMQSMYNGAIYAVLPAAHPSRVQNSMGGMIVVNEDIIASLITTDPRDYFENGTWNWETFTNCLNTYAHTSGISNEYVYSFSCNGYGGIARGLAMSNGVDYVTLDDSGNVKEIGYVSQLAIDAYNQAYDWLYGSTADNVLSTGGEANLVSGFISGNSAMMLTNVWRLLANSDSIAYRLDNYGLVPVPVGPNASGPDDYKITTSSALFSTCIPITAKDAEISAFIIDKIYAPFEGYETKEDMIDYLTKNYFHDRRDSVFFIEMIEDDHVWFHPSRHSNFQDQIPNTGVASGVEANEEVLFKEMENDIFPMYKTMLQYEELFHK